MRIALPLDTQVPMFWLELGGRVYEQEAGQDQQWTARSNVRRERSSDIIERVPDADDCTRCLPSPSDGRPEVKTFAILDTLSVVLCLDNSASITFTIIDQLSCDCVVLDDISRQESSAADARANDIVEPLDTRLTNSMLTFSSKTERRLGIHHILCIWLGCRISPRVSFISYGL